MSFETPQKHDETRGSIVLVSTAAAQIGFANHEAIAAAKLGLEGLARASAASYANRNIRVNVVAPGLVNTPLAAPIVNHAPTVEASTRMHSLGQVVPQKTSHMPFSSSSKALGQRDKPWLLMGSLRHKTAEVTYEPLRQHCDWCWLWRARSSYPVGGRRAKGAFTEALKYAGGCAATFKKGDYQFEAGATLFSGFQKVNSFRSGNNAINGQYNFRNLTSTICFRSEQLGELNIPPNRGPLRRMGTTVPKVSTSA